MKCFYVQITVILFSLNLMAQPTTINCQGKLPDNDGNAVFNPEMAITFAIFNAAKDGNFPGKFQVYSTVILEKEIRNFVNQRSDFQQSSLF